ncbi:hypothetical protein ACA910_018416 [Epithemia clementina (nom. ined.)]
MTTSTRRRAWSFDVLVVKICLILLCHPTGAGAFAPIHQRFAPNNQCYRQEELNTNTDSCCCLFQAQNRQTRIIGRSIALNVATDVASSSVSADAGGGGGSSSSSSHPIILERMRQLRSESMDYATSFGLSPSKEGAFYALFRAIRLEDFVRQQKPFVLRHDQVQNAMKLLSNNGSNDDDQSSVVAWPGFFSMKHLEKALEDDFLDAARGSTDNRKGWKITDVSVPRGESFEEARMTYEDVQAALEKGTVIFNAAGAHIPSLAGPTLACTDATALPCGLNLYITAAGQRTSAPPHTDKQDVVVIQSTGCKYWRVYSPPNPADKPLAEPFARGKMDDSLPLYMLEKDLGCQMLLETTLYPGDVLFIPAAFPHTTSTILPNSDRTDFEKETSIHLTMGFDHHIWDLDYLSVRRFALRRAGVVDTALGRTRDDENPYTGPCNELPAEVHNALFAELPLGFLEEDENSALLLEQVTKDVERISLAVDETTARQVPPEIWRESVERVRKHGMDLLETHRNMYLAALEEGRIREAEEAMTAHLNNDSSGGRKKVVMTPERIQRLSLFRVKRFFDEIDQAKKSLREWSWQGSNEATMTTSTVGSATVVASDPTAFAYGSTAQSSPTTAAVIKVGDQVEADLGGAFFPATVTRVSADNNSFDVQFFDGDRETGLTRSQVKLIAPAVVATQPEEVDTSHMTPKQLKRWRKQQEKLQQKS